VILEHQDNIFLATPSPCKDLERSKTNFELINAAQTIHNPNTRESEEPAKQVFKEEPVQYFKYGELMYMMDRQELTQTGRSTEAGPSQFEQLLTQKDIQIEVVARPH
jgi:hypothetical protein